MVLSIPVRLSDGSGNIPAAANWNDDNDWLTSLLLGLAFISNGGMEVWTAGTTFTNPTNGTVLSDGWTEVKSGTSPCTADVTREGTTVDTGLYSMKVNITGAGSSDSYWAVKQSVVTPSAFGGVTVLAGVKVKVATANKVRIKVYDGATTVFSSYHIGDGTWQLLQAKLTCASNPSEVTITIEINPANFTDAVYIDSSYLYVVPSAISSRAQQALVFTPLSAAGSFLPLSGGTMTGALNMNSHKITNLTNGSASSDAAAFGQIPVIVNPTAYTPTYSAGWGTVANSNVFYAQIGKMLFIWGSFQCGTVAGSAGTITLPGGYTLDTTHMVHRRTFFGPANDMFSGSNVNVFGGSHAGYFIYDNGSSTTVEFSDLVGGGTELFQSRSVNGFFSSSDYVSLNLVIPVQ